jgi:ubiquitin-conjugating enzyme E2 M
LYKGRTLKFVIDIPKDYPFTGPKIKIKNKIYHPNVDEEGRVCLEILREGWSCGFGLENIFINLFCILMEPSNENALNGEVGEMMEKDYEEFEKRAREVK